jgi:OOP family OmpA-OmpF porin
LINIYQKNWLIGAQYSHLSNFKYANTDTSTDIYRYGLNATYELNYENISPYLTAGIGREHVDYTINHNDSATYVKMGVGIKYYLSDNFNIQTEISDYSKISNHRHDVTITAGLGYIFGDKKENLDKDFDGVLNSVDKCPNTPRNTQVDSNGCKIIKIQIERPPVFKLVPQIQKQETKAIQEVKVEKIFELIINFDFSKTDVKIDYNSKIRDLIAVLKAYPNAKIELSGHTDDIATKKFNQELSEKRAKKVANILSSNGIESSRISTIGYGENRPIASNDTEENRSKNRRVEIKISY